MQLWAAAGAPGSAPPAGGTQPGQTPRHHNRGGRGGWRWCPSEGGSGWRGSPCGPVAPRPQPGAACSSRRRPLTRPCAPAAARCGPGARPAGGAERAERGCRLPPSAARRAAPSTPPAAASPARGRAPSLLPAAARRSLGLRPVPPPGAARAVQVAALPRKPEAERRAPGFQVPSPRPAPRGAGPRARDAPPRGTVRAAGRPPLRSPGLAEGDLPLPASQTQTGAPRSLSKTRSASTSPPRGARLLAQVAPHRTTPPFPVV